MNITTFHIKQSTPNRYTKGTRHLDRIFVVDSIFKFISNILDNRKQSVVVYLCKMVISF